MVLAVTDHPNADRLWLADVDIGQAEPVRIVFGGQRRVEPGELVPVAPPGARIFTARGWRKMRARRYRGQRSHGMLCSLVELGWIDDGPDEVAVLGRVAGPAV